MYSSGCALRLNSSPRMARVYASTKFWPRIHQVRLPSSLTSSGWRSEKSKYSGAALAFAAGVGLLLSEDRGSDASYDIVLLQIGQLGDDASHAKTTVELSTRSTRSSQCQTT